MKININKLYVTKNCSNNKERNGELVIEEKYKTETQRVHNYLTILYAIAWSLA